MNTEEKNTDKKERGNPYNTSVEELPESRVMIRASIPWEEVERERAGALLHLGKDVSIKGFRKGKVPEHMLVEHIGEGRLLTEMSERALSKVYPEILTLSSVSTLGRPKISITKMTPGNPLEFSAETAVMPNIELPDYKKIAGKVKVEANAGDVEEKEIEDAQQHIREQWAKQEKYKALLEKADDKEQVDPQSITVDEKELPEFNDAFVKQLGDFENVDDFKKKLKENLAQEKKSRADEKKRIEILDSILSETVVDIPEVIIEAELDKMESQFEADVARAGVNLQDYLKSVDKSKEDLRKEWRDDARKRAKTQLVLNKIALEESIKPDKENVEKEVEHVLKHYPNAKENQARIYVESMLTNSEVIKFLEKQSSS